MSFVNYPLPVLISRSGPASLGVLGGVRCGEVCDPARGDAGHTAWAWPHHGARADTTPHHATPRIATDTTPSYAKQGTSHPIPACTFRTTRREIPLVEGPPRTQQHPTYTRHPSAAISGFSGQGICRARRPQSAYRLKTLAHGVLMVVLIYTNKIKA